MTAPTITAWAIKAPDGQWLYELFIKRTRKESIGVFLDDGPDRTWKQAYRKGFRCVKVQITEMEDGK